ncbi:porin [Celeribacter sp.]|uniref:porin n=1 Tax=Celeribacter sp. TaxID=1890673 RepID=UPI003A9489AC
MKTLMTVLAVTTAFGTGAMAQEITHATAGVTYTNLSATGGSADLLSYGGSVEAAVNNFVFGAGFGGVSLDEGDVDLTSFSLDAAYEFVPGAFVFGRYRYAEVSVGGGSADTNSWSLGAEYTTGAVSFGLSYNDLDDVDEALYSGFINYAIDASTDVYFTGLRIDGESVFLLGTSRETDTYSVDAGYGWYEDDVDLLSVSMSYNVMPNVRLTGDIAHLSIGGADADYWGIGAGYKVAQNVWLDAAYGQVDAMGDDLDVFSVGIKFDLGKSKLASSRLNSNVTDLLPAALDGFSF